MLTPDARPLLKNAQLCKSDFLEIDLVALLDDEISLPRARLLMNSWRKTISN